MLGDLHVDSPDSQRAAFRSVGAVRELYVRTNFLRAGWDICLLLVGVSGLVGLVARGALSSGP